MHGSVIRRYALLERVRHQGQDFLTLVEQQHDTQITQTLVSEPWTCYELEAFHLSEMGLGAKHVDVEQLGHIVVSCVGVFFSK